MSRGYSRRMRRDVVVDRGREAGGPVGKTCKVKGKAAFVNKCRAESSITRVSKWRDDVRLPSNSQETTLMISVITMHIREVI